MRALLDTHVLLWWIAEPERLSTPALEFLRDGANDPVWSAAGTMELAIKSGTGRLRIPGTLESFLEEQRASLGLEFLSVEHRHALRLASLPLHHGDPFDRLLVAQAQVEGLPLVTADGRMRAYEVPILW